MTTPPPPLSTEQRELALVEKVDFRILNVANNEKKLQDLLERFLVPLLLKGASEHASVRAKVATVAQRLKLFIQPPSVVLPVAALVAQFKSTDSAVVRHLDLGFIQHSIGRLPAKDRRALLPALLKGIARVNSATPALFEVVLQTLAVLRLPPRGSAEDDAFAAAIGLDDAADAAYVAERFGKIFLLSRSASAAAQMSLASAADDVYFGYNQPTSWLRTGTNLAETRIRVANFLASGAFAADVRMRFMPALYAAAHTDSRVATIGEDVLKRTKVSLETAELVDELYAAHAVLPAAHRIRILGLLSRSALAATYDDHILKVVQRNMDTGDGSGSGSGSGSGEGTARARGLETAKLHRALFEFINWVARVGPGKGTTTSSTSSFKIGRQLIDYLQQYVTSLGWPVPSSSSSSASASMDAEPLRAKAYETIGMLAKGAHMTTAERLGLAEWLFRSLTEDPTGEVVVNVDGALSSLSGVFAPGATASTAEDRATIEPRLHKLLLHYMEVDGDDEAAPHIRRSARHAAAKWANTCLAFADPVARWIDVVAAAGRRGERSDVVEEGLKGLDPWTYSSRGAEGVAVALPSWSELVRVFFGGRIGGGETETTTNDMDVDAASHLTNFAGDKVHAYALAVGYCRRMLLLTALSGQIKIEPGWEQQVETLVQSDKKTRGVVRGYLRESNDKSAALGNLLTAALEGMLLGTTTTTTTATTALAEPCGRSFVELASLAPRSVLACLAARAPELLALVRSNKKEVRTIAAAAVGILGAHPANSTSTLQSLKAKLVAMAQPWKTAVGAELNASEGAFVALAHLLSRGVFYGRADKGDLVGDATDLFPGLDDMKGASASLRDALFDALAQLWTAGVRVPAAEAVEPLVDVLATEAGKGNERAIAALGRMAMAWGGDKDSEEEEEKTEATEKTDITDLILTKLYALYELKQAEVHFAIGGAITAAVACWDADVVEVSLDVDVDETKEEEEEQHNFRTPKRPRRLESTLAKLLTDCKTTKPSLLKASGIWLFSLIQHTARLPEVQAQLRACQAAFMRLLSARDELVQETASRGLSLVYASGDSLLKKKLVQDLVSTFTGTGPKLEVDGDTQLFEAGALPTGSGGSGSSGSSGQSVTSYRDIVSLASEVGDQTLVYKFMALAANAATWSTRSAFGRFGLSSILSDAESASSAVDPRLYPKLFRYRFDPNPNVQRSMDGIWRALVKDSGGATVDAHFDAIMTDLLQSILGKEWRVREASAAALADLVQGRPFSQYAQYYGDVWARALRVMDDVKGSVRAAALRLCGTLANTLVRQLEGSSGATGSGSTSGGSGSAALSQALPFLLSDKGIESGVEDVKVFATVTVLKIAKHAGPALRPYVASLVPHLLGLLSTIEPQAVNYYYLRSGADDQDKLDKMRSAMVSQSPISEAIDDCLRGSTVDAAVLAELSPALETSMASAVGMPTKIGCGRVLTTLATRHALDFAAYAPRFLQLVGGYALADRNDEVAQSYAKTAAYLLRAVPPDGDNNDDTRISYATRLVDAYFAADDDTRRQRVADAVLALATISPDHFGALEGRLLPWVFLGKHDVTADHDYVQKACTAVWAKHAGSTGLAVARYIPEISGLVERALDTAQWAHKHAGARTAAAAVAAVLSAADVSGHVNEASLRVLWPLYARALAQKTFDGKQDVLAVLPDFVTKARGLWTKDSAMAAALRKIATVEAKRNNDAYRVHALRCLGRVAAARDDVDMWGDVVAIGKPHLVALTDLDSQMDTDDNDDKKDPARETRLRDTAEAALVAIVSGYYRPALEANPSKVLADVWAAVGSSVTSPSFLLTRRTVWYKAVGELLEAAAAVDVGTSESSSNNDLPPYLASLDVDHAEAGTEAQRSNRARALKALAKAVKRGVLGGAAEQQAVVAAAVNKALAVERSQDVQKLLKEAAAEGR